MVGGFFKPSKLCTMGFMSIFKSRFVRIPEHKRFDFQPRYYDQEEEERKSRRSQQIRLEKGAFYNSKNKSRLVGAFSDKDVVYRQKIRRGGGAGQLFRVLLIAAMLTLITGFLTGMVKSLATMAVSIGAIILLMIVFITKGNRV